MTESEASFSIRDFLREIALAWQRFALYPPGHPAQNELVDRSHHILLALVAPTGSVILGVQKDSLLYGGETLDGESATRLAETLFIRSVAVVRFEEGVSSQELKTFLNLLPRKATTGNEEPLWDQLRDQGVENIFFEPVDFAGIVVEEGEDRLEEVKGGKTAPLWRSLLRRLMGDELVMGYGLEADENSPTSLEDILKVIRRYLHQVETENSNAGSSATPPAKALSHLSGMLGIGVSNELRRAPTQKAREAAAQHIAELISAIPEEMQQEILDSALTALVQEADATSILSLSDSQTAAHVMASLRRLRERKVPISSSILNQLQDLIFAKPNPEASSTPVEEEALTEGLKAILQEGDVDRHVALESERDRLTFELPSAEYQEVNLFELEPRLESLMEKKVIMTLAQTLLDLFQRPIFSESQREGIVLRMVKLVQGLLASGQINAAIRIIHTVKILAEDPQQSAHIGDTARLCMGSLDHRDTIDALVEALVSLPSDSAYLVQEFINLLGAQMTSVMLTAMCEENDMGRRRHLFDLLVSLGSKAVPDAILLLGDSRWYVQRNMLTFLIKIRGRIPLDVLRNCLAHTDAKVRLEAIKALNLVEDVIPAAVLGPLVRDVDAQVAETTVSAIGKLRLPEGYGVLRDLLKQPDRTGRFTTLRVKALKALGQLGRPEVLADLAPFFRILFAPATTEERRAAFQSLQGYPVESRVPWLKKGLKSPDNVIRSICQKMDRRA